MINNYWGKKAGGFFDPSKDKVGFVAGLIVRGKRSHATMKGCRHFPIPNVGMQGGFGSFRTTIYKKLASNALAMGWLDGKRLRPAKGGR